MPDFGIFFDSSLDGFYPALAAGEIKPGTVIIFRYQGPKGAPGMPEVCHLIRHIYIRMQDCHCYKKLPTLRLRHAPIPRRFSIQSVIGLSVSMFNTGPHVSMCFIVVIVGFALSLLVRPENQEYRSCPCAVNVHVGVLLCVA